MKYFNKVVLAVAVGCVLAALPVVAKPGGGGGGSGGFGGGMGGGLTPEQVLGLLAFDDKFAVTDKQLVALRAGLKESYAKQREMMEELMSGDVDWQAMREGQAAMRTEVMEIVAGVLSAEQMDTLKRHMAEAQERRGGMGGNRGGTRGGGGGF